MKAMLAEMDYIVVEILTVPTNMKILAIPLFELYDNAVRFVASPDLLLAM